MLKFLKKLFKPKIEFVIPDEITDINEILLQDDLLPHLYLYLGNKSKTGSDYSLLNETEKTIALTINFLFEYRSGYLTEYFNWVKSEAGECVKALEVIGATKASNILKEFINKFPDSITEGLTEESETYSNRYNEVIDTDELDALIIKYVNDNKKDLMM